jgi:4-hydroxybenzoate polyprenyltransferase
VRATIALEGPNVLTYVRALRIHQWLKNLLVWLPLAAAHELGSVAGLTQGLIAFLAFGFCASAVYVLNDLLDLEADRVHVRKRRRPFASGAIPVWQGTVLIPVLLLASAVLAAQLPWAFGAVLAGYFGMTLAYSVRLKRQVIVDVLLLAALYTTRVVAGAAATGVLPSFWLLAMSMFLFLSLAMVKRYSELLLTLDQNKTIAPGRGYSVQDLPVLMAIGVSSGMTAVMVLALYVNAPEATLHYQHKLWLWVLPSVLLYWISRVWMKAHRGEVDDDPVVFAARDWQSQVIGVIFVLLLWLAS